MFDPSKDRCPKHPRYQAKQNPTSRCWHCLRIWNYNRRVRQAEALARLVRARKRAQDLRFSVSMTLQDTAEIAGLLEDLADELEREIQYARDQQGLG